VRTVLYVSVLRSMEDLLSNAPSEADLTNMIFYITSNSMIRIFNHNHTIIIYHPFYSFTSVTMIHYCSYSTMCMFFSSSCLLILWGFMATCCRLCAGKHFGTRDDIRA